MLVPPLCFWGWCVQWAEPRLSVGRSFSNRGMTQASSSSPSQPPTDHRSLALANASGPKGDQTLHTTTNATDATAAMVAPGLWLAHSSSRQCQPVRRCCRCSPAAVGGFRAELPLAIVALLSLGSFV